MAALIKARTTAAFLKSEAAVQGHRSRGTQVFDSTTDWAGAAIPVGQVYAIVGGVAVAFDGNAVDGSEDAAGILYEAVGAAEDVNRTVIVRDAEVTIADLTYDGTVAEVTASLAAIGIIVR
jgi:hypothetical protein